MKPLFYILSLVCFTMHLSAQCNAYINNFPYHEGFETSDGDWIPGGALPDWAWGMPSKTVIKNAANGRKCWITGGLSKNSYNDLEYAWLRSPCFDFSKLQHPYISFNIFWETERKYDGALLQYSTDYGNSWHTIGSVDDVVDCKNSNWYNDADIVYLGNGDGWSGNVQSSNSNCVSGAGSGTWLKAQHTLEQLTGYFAVGFRFLFASGTTCNNYDGFAIDDIYIGEEPANADVSVMQTSPILCNGDNNASALAVMAGSTTGYMFEWNTIPVQTTAEAKNLPAGMYTVLVKLAGTCDASANITISEPAKMQVTVIAQQPVCISNNGSIVLNVTGGTTPYKYSWFPLSNNTNILNNLGSGNYSYTITDNNNCSLNEVVSLTAINNLSISLGNDTTICAGDKIMLSPGNFSSYLWQDNSTAPIYTVTKGGNYNVTVTDSVGCTARESIHIEDDCGDIFFPGAFTPNGDNVNDGFGPLGNRYAISNYSLRIYNRWGKLVYQTKDPFAKWYGTSGNNGDLTNTYVWLAKFDYRDKKNIIRKGTLLALH